MPSRRLIALLPLTFALAVPATAQAQGIVPGVSKIRDNGIGKVYTGMTIKKARQAAGIPLDRSRVGDCVYLSATPGSPDGPDLRFNERQAAPRHRRPRRLCHQARRRGR